jgi:hypothetical protein
VSEAEKKKNDRDQGVAADRPGNVKPFPDFITPPPGGAGSAPTQSAVIDPPAMKAPSQPVPPGKPQPVPPGKPPKARGGGWAFLFALVSLTAAGISLSAPSLRPIAAEKLKQQFGDHYWIGVLTGTADTRPPSVIDLDLKQFDARLQALANTLTTANPGAPVDAQTLARFADAAGATQRMQEFETALNQLKAGESEQISLLSQALGRMEAALAESNQRTEATEGVVRTLAEQLKNAETQAGRAAELAEQADTGAKEVATSLGGMLRKLETAEAGLADLATKLAAVGGQVGQQINTALGPVNARLDGMDKRAAETTAQAATALETVRVEAASVAGNFAGLAEELKAMQALEAAQDGRLGGVIDEAKALKTGLIVVADRLQAVEQTVERQKGASGGALLGLANRLRIAVDEGEPFLAEMAAIKSLAGGDPAFAQPLGVLALLAERGAPSLSYLRRDFNVLARKIVEAEEAAQPAWYTRQWWNVQYYLGLSGGPTAVADGTTAGGEAARAVLAQAAGAINAGQFADAAATMASLSGSAADMAQGWIGAARARVAADQAVRAFSAAALTRVGR